MTWTYEQSTGYLTAPDGSLTASGYSGHPPCVNSPQDQFRSDLGPIPEGAWTIETPHTDPEKGPVVMALTPAAGTNTFGRSGFLIHGDLIGEAGEHLASHGCIILAHPVREEIAASEDKDLQVIP